MKLTLVLLASACVWAQSAIAPPKLGWALDGAGALRPIYGLAGNFMLGPAARQGVVAEAFSGSIGLLKTDSSLAAFDLQGRMRGSVDTGEGTALFAFSPDGTSALAYIQANHALIAWRAGTFTTVSFDPRIAEGDVLAVSLPSASEPTLIVEKRGTVWELRLGSLKALSGVRSPLLVLPSGDLLYTGDGCLVIRRADASEVRLASSLPSHFSLRQMNADWVQFGDFAVHTSAGHEGIYRLPEAGQ
jgi:hypothetical protein